MYKTTQFSTPAPLHNGGRGGIEVTTIEIGADHSKRPILKTEPGDSEPGWGSSPQWSGPPLSPPRLWTKTQKIITTQTSAILGKKIVTLNLRWPVQWAPPCLRGPSRPDCPLSDLKVNNLFWVNMEGGGRARARIQQLLQDHSFQDIHLFHLLGEPFPSYFHLVGSLLPSSPLGQELHWGSRSRPHTSWVESSFTCELLFLWWFWI